MKEIVPIYKNQVGLGFFWRKSGRTLDHRIQLIFRDTGFYLSRDEVFEFHRSTKKALAGPRCSSCETQECCRSIFLKTPFVEVDLVVSNLELEGMEELLSGILFHLSLREYLTGLSLN